MSRNASGTYSLPAGNPVITGTTIASNWANTTLNDLAAEMTDSLDRSGKGGMLAALKLVDGAVGTPALAFSSEGASGLYRAGANDVRLAVAGADKLRLTDASAAPALTFTSPQTAAGTQDDFQFATGNLRTAGYLLRVLNGGSERLALSPTAVVTLGGGLASGSGAFIVATPPNGYLGLSGNKDGADTGYDVRIYSQNTRSNGALLSVQNAGVEKFKVAYDGSITAAGTLTTIAMTADGTGSITALGSALAQLTLQDSSIVGAEKRALSLQADFVNTEVAYWSPVNWRHRFYYNVNVEGTLSCSPNANSTLNLQGNRSAADGSTDVLVAPVANRTAGRIFGVWNGGAEKFAVGWDGTLYQNGSVFAGTWTAKFATGDVTCAASATTDITGLAFSMSSGVTYRVRAAILVVDTADATTVMAIQAKSAGAPTVSVFRGTEIGCTSGSNVLSQAVTTAFGTAFASHNNNTAGNYAPRYHEFVITTTSTGTFQLQCVVGAGNAYTVSKGSYLEYAVVQ